MSRRRSGRGGLGGGCLVDVVLGMELESRAGEEFGIGDLIEVGGVAEDALGFLAPVGGEAGFLQLLFDVRKSLQEKLTGVSEGDGFAASDAAGELVDDEFAEDDVDGGGGLEVADGGEDVGGDGVAVGDAAHLLGQMVMAEGGVAGVEGVGAAFAVGAEMGAAVGAAGGGLNRFQAVFRRLFSVVRQRRGSTFHVWRGSRCGWHVGPFKSKRYKVQGAKCKGGSVSPPPPFFVSIDSRRVSAGRIRKYGI